MAAPSGYESVVGRSTVNGSSGVPQPAANGSHRGSVGAAALGHPAADQQQQQFQQLQQQHGQSASSMQNHSHQRSASALFDAFANLSVGPQPSQPSSSSAALSPQPGPAPGNIPNSSNPNGPPRHASDPYAPKPQPSQHPNAAVPASFAVPPSSFLDQQSALDNLASHLSAQPSVPAAQKRNPNPAVPAMWPRRSGVVKFFNSTKGFGFIWDNNSNEIGEVDIFVHWTTIQGEAQFKSLGEGEMVEYDLGRGPKGFQALNVTGPNGGSVQGDPMARMPLALGRLLPPSRFNPMAMGLPMQAYGLSPYGPHPAAHIDPAFAAHFLQAGARYMPHPQAAFFPMQPSHATASPVPTSSAQTSLGNYSSTASTREPSSTHSAASTAATHGTAAGSAYAHYLAAANAQQPYRQPVSGPGSPVYSFDVRQHSQAPISDGYGAYGGSLPSTNRAGAYGQAGRPVKHGQGQSPLTSTLSSTAIHHFDGGLASQQHQQNGSSGVESHTDAQDHQDALAFFGNSAAWRKQTL